MKRYEAENGRYAVKWKHSGSSKFGFKEPKKTFHPVAKAKKERKLTLRLARPFCLRVRLRKGHGSDHFLFSFPVPHTACARRTVVRRQSERGLLESARLTRASCLPERRSPVRETFTRETLTRRLPERCSTAVLWLSNVHGELIQVACITVAIRYRTRWLFGVLLAPSERYALFGHGQADRLCGRVICKKVPHCYTHTQRPVAYG